MEFNISDLPDPENRGAQQWVTYYKRVINAVAMGKKVQVNGKTIEHHELNDLIREQNRWESLATDVTAKSTGRPARAPIYIA